MHLQDLAGMVADGAAIGERGWVVRRFQRHHGVPAYHKRRNPCGLLGPFLPRAGQAARPQDLSVLAGW